MKCYRDNQSSRVLMSGDWSSEAGVQSTHGGAAFRCDAAYKFDSGLSKHLKKIFSKIKFLWCTFFCHLYMTSLYIYIYNCVKHVELPCIWNVQNEDSSLVFPLAWYVSSKGKHVLYFSFINPQLAWIWLWLCAHSHTLIYSLHTHTHIHASKKAFDLKGLRLFSSKTPTILGGDQKWVNNPFAPPACLFVLRPCFEIKK